LSVSDVVGFRAFLIKLAEGVRHGVGAADGDVQNTLRWLRDEHPARLSAERRKAHRAAELAIEDLRRKRLQPTATGQPQSVVSEKKALAKTKAKLDWIDQRAAATKRWASHFDKEASQYQGATQPARSLPDATLPRALSRLDAHLAAIEAYLALETPPTPGGQPTADDAASVSRPADDKTGTDESTNNANADEATGSPPRDPTHLGANP